MRVALVHNFYRGVIPSGEDLNVREHQELVGPEIDVIIHSTTNRYVGEHPVRGRWRALASGLELPGAGRGFAERILDSRPACVHVENLTPLLPERLVGELLAEVRVVRRWGNYRFRCPSGNNFRDGAPCHECDTLGRKLPAVRHACYAGRRSASATVAFRPDPLRPGSGLVHVAVSEHVAGELRSAGATADDVMVIPNSVPGPAGGRSPALGSRDVLFLGSLAEKKGLLLLLDAWPAVRRSHPGSRLRVVGDGPLRWAVEAAAALDGSIDLVGGVGYEEGRRALAEAHVLVAPSLWDEPFGRVVVESLAEGTPVIVSDRGGLPETVSDETGWTVQALDAPGLATVLDDALSVSEAQRRTMGDAARARYRDRYSVAAVRPLWHRAYGGDR